MHFHSGGVVLMQIDSIILYGACSHGGLDGNLKQYNTDAENFMKTLKENFKNVGIGLFSI